MFSSYFEKLRSFGIIPVIKLDSADLAVPLGKALFDAGLPIAEVTFRTDAAEESIKRINDAFPDILLGAGTVSSANQVDCAVKAGAKFIVSPGFNDEVVKHCVENKIPVLPGCSNPSDIERALSYGLSTVKFFPAEVAGGIKAIKAMAAPYVNVKFVPTGGINENNVREYLEFDKIIACGGSWMVPDKLIKAGNFEEIMTLTKGAIKKSLGIKLSNVGLNNSDISLNLFKVFELISSDTTIEHCNEDSANNNCITLATLSVDRAMQYFKTIGLSFDSANADIGDDGQTESIYLSERIGDIKIRLVKG